MKTMLSISVVVVVLAIGLIIGGGVVAAQTICTTIGSSTFCDGPKLPHPIICTTIGSSTFCN